MSSYILAICTYMQEKSNIANCDKYKLTSKNAMFKKLLHDRNHTLKLAGYLVWTHDQNYRKMHVTECRAPADQLKLCQS